MPYRYVTGAASPERLIEHAATHEVETPDYQLGKDNIHELFTPAMEVFSDGEIKIVPELNASVDGKLSFTERYPDGSYGRMIFDLYELAKEDVDSELTDEVNRFARFCGSLLSKQHSSGLIQLPPNTSFVRYRDDEVIVNGKFRSGITPGSTIIDIGAGLNGRYLIDRTYKKVALLERIMRSKNDRREDLHLYAPNVVVPISHGPFINQFLMDYSLSIQKRIFPGSRWINSDYLVGREDGMSEATQAILDGNRAAGVSTQISSVIQMTGLQDAEAGQLASTIKNVPQLLRPGGIVIFTAPIRSTAEEQVTIAEINELAGSLNGIQQVFSGEVDTGSILVHGSLLRSGISVFQSK